MKPLRVLGVDPGLTATGYGVVEQAGSRLLPLDFGVVRTVASQPLSERLETIYRALEQVIGRWQPDAGAIEEVFNKKNFQASVKIAYARATAMLALRFNRVPVFEYTGTEMKKALAGYGLAEKSQVQSMVQRLLGLREPPTPIDASDALGHAICHIQHVPLLRRLEAVQR